MRPGSSRVGLYPIVGTLYSPGVGPAVPVVVLLGIGLPLRAIVC